MKAESGVSRHAALVPLYGVVDKKPRPLDEELIIVGRARGCDIVLDAPEVSSLHCVIYRWGGGYRMRDCASRTGTRINGDPRKAAPLHDGDIFQVGPFSFNISLPDDHAATAALGLKEQRHLQKSRRGLAKQALRLRRRLHCVLAAEPDSLQQELKQKASGLRARIRTFDQRLADLEAAERDLAADRDALGQAQEAHANHVQKVEAELAERLTAADAEVHRRWQEFQQRCQHEEAHLQQLRHQAAHDTVSHSQPSNPENSPLNEERRTLAETRAALVHRQEELQHMKEQWTQEQGAAEQNLQKQQAALAQAEAALKEQRQQLHGMIAQLRSLQEAVRKEQKVDAGILARENDQLKKQLADAHTQVLAARRHDELAQARAQHAKRLEEENADLRRMLEAFEQQPLEAPANPEVEQQLQELREENQGLRSLLSALEQHETQSKDVAGLDHEADTSLHQENELLRQLLHEKDALFEEMKQKVVAASAPKPVRAESDLEHYETELTQYRQQLESDRAKFNKEIEQLRMRNQELDEATREMELELSRERAELARERQRLDRMREEVRSEQERINRDGAVRESLAPVQKLREEMNQKKNPAAAKGLNDPMRSLRNRS